MAISRTQAAAIAELSQREPGFSSISETARANLVTLASSAMWQGDDLSLVLRLLAPPESPPEASGNGGKPGQVWAPAVLAYIPTELWDELKRCGSTTSAQDLLISFVGGIGGEEC